MHHELNLEFFVFHKKGEGQKKWRWKNWKNFKLEKDMDCNYLHMPYLESHLEATLQC